jgi:hypothetical protein
MGWINGDPTDSGSVSQQKSLTEDGRAFLFLYLLAFRAEPITQTGFHHHQNEAIFVCCFMVFMVR